MTSAEQLADEVLSLNPDWPAIGPGKMARLVALAQQVKNDRRSPTRLTGQTVMSMCKGSGCDYVFNPRTVLYGTSASVVCPKCGLGQSLHVSFGDVC